MVSLLVARKTRNIMITVRLLHLCARNIVMGNPLYFNLENIVVLKERFDAVCLFIYNEIIQCFA